MESRYGTRVSRRVSARMTFPSADSDALIKQASRRAIPAVAAWVWRSLPARSMRWNWDLRVTVMESSTS